MIDAVITSWVRMQATPAFSSEEAELHAIGSGFVETLFVRHLLGELGYDVRAEVRTDSHVARPVVLSQGLRRMKHIELRFLFAQEVTKPQFDRNAKMDKLLTSRNLKTENIYYCGRNAEWKCAYVLQICILRMWTFILSRLQT